MENNVVLSGEQEAIKAKFATGRGHFVVDAKAGTGKTFTSNLGISVAPEDKKLYVAFNKKNVDEAKEKIECPLTEVMSLNGLGFRFVLENRKGCRPDDSVEIDRIKTVVAGPDFRRFQYTPFNIIKEIVAFAKNTRPFASEADCVEIAVHRGLQPEGFMLQQGWSIALCANVAYRALQLAKAERGAGKISYNDQLWLPIVNGWARAKYDLIVADEAQDLSPTQHLLVRASVTEGGRIVLVGDPNQAIYGWRGADVNGMAKFIAETGCEVLPLSITRRCPKAVVALAAQLVPGYQAAPDAPEGVVDEMSGSAALVEAAVPGNAIVSRLNAPLMPLALAFIRKGVKAYIEGRDFGAALLTIHKGIKASSPAAYITAVGEWADKRIAKLAGDDSEANEAAINAISDQAQTLVALAEESESSAEIETRLTSLFKDSNGDKDSFVVLSSTHRAKGLEWNRVFLLRDTYKAQMAPLGGENQNLLYVGLTRAKAHLTLVYGVNAKGPAKKRKAR